MALCRDFCQESEVLPRKELIKQPEGLILHVLPGKRPNFRGRKPTRMALCSADLWYCYVWVKDLAKKRHISSIFAFSMFGGKPPYLRTCLVILICAGWLRYPMISPPSWLNESLLVLLLGSALYITSKYHNKSYTFKKYSQLTAVLDIFVEYFNCR